MSIINKIKNSKIRKDPFGYFFMYAMNFRLAINCFFSTLTCKCFLKLKRVKYGSGIKFYGRSTIVRHPLSEINIGDNCSFRSSYISNLVGLNHRCTLTTMRHSATLTLGKNCGVSSSVIAAAERITLGENVLVGANSLITDYDWHNIRPEIRLDECKITKPVTIGNNVWIGANCVVLKGVTIGENTVIAANSVVVKDVPANVIAGGNPCVALKNLV